MRTTKYNPDLMNIDTVKCQTPKQIQSAIRVLLSEIHVYQEIIDANMLAFEEGADIDLEKENDSARKHVRKLKCEVARLSHLKWRMEKQVIITPPDDWNGDAN